MSDATPVLWSHLPVAEARARFDAFVTGHEKRLAEFVDEVRRRSGPAARLDGTLESLDPLWDWIVAEHPRGADDAPFAPADGRPVGEPWWQVHHPPWAQELGPYVAWLAGGWAEYLYACVFAAKPGSKWVLGRGRNNADFQHPVLSIVGRGEMPYSVPLVIALQWLGASGSAARRTSPRAVLEIWLGLDAEYEARSAELSRPRADFAVEAIVDDGFTHVISFDDVVAHFQEWRIAGLLRAFADIPAIEAAIHSDREIVYLRAPQLSVADLESIITAAWTSNATRSHADRRANVE